MPSPRWASVPLASGAGRLATISTWWSARKAARSARAGSSNTVRLLRSITWHPCWRASSTNRRKAPCNSGAPPVRSTTSGRRRPIASRHCCTTGSAIWLAPWSGPASTWQWLHCMLQRRPRLSCNTRRAERRGAASCRWARAALPPPSGPRPFSSSWRCCWGVRARGRPWAVAEGVGTVVVTGKRDRPAWPSKRA